MTPSYLSHFALTTVSDTSKTGWFVTGAVLAVAILAVLAIGAILVVRALRR